MTLILVYNDVWWVQVSFVYNMCRIYGRVHEAYRKILIKFQLSKERIEGSEHKDRRLKATFIGC